MKNPRYNIGQRIETQLSSFDYQTSAEFEQYYQRCYGFIYKIKAYPKKFVFDDGSTGTVTWISYYVLVMRKEIDRIITFDDGHQYEKYYKHETLNLSCESIVITEGEGAEDWYSVCPVENYNFRHEGGLFD